MQGGMKMDKNMKSQKQFKKELLCEVGGAWLITWEFYSQDKHKKIKELGIKDEIVDIIDSHKKFDDVLEYVKKIYVLLNGDYCDKLGFAKRGRYKIDEKEFFSRQPLMTSYKTSIYKNLIRALETKGIKSIEYKKLGEKWKKYPQYISIGLNPSIYARKVKNLKVHTNDKGELIEWQEKNVNGDWNNRKYIKNYDSN